MSELIRAFIAVKLPEDIADSLEDFLDDIRPLSRIHWVKREQFHITLKFLGELEPDVIDDVKECLIPMKYFEPFTIELSHIGAFPNMKNANVLWLGCSRGAKELANLSRRINDSLFRDAELERDTRKFRAHLTLARLKGERVSEDVINQLGTFPLMNWPCDELVLMRSVLTPKGPIYTQIL
ncbi:MAG: RNA 2',3'-cyclic phosphodiesterase [Synergistaceae bacterium]|nr:RNA 2',3'-cyclic phosphodiesterase [Synergistaceae bacterium]